MKISEFLSIGEGEAVSLHALSVYTGLPERSVRYEILRERLNGELILSSDRGYFLPADEYDIKKYVNTRKSYLRTAHAALRPFIKALSEGAS